MQILLENGIPIIFPLRTSRYISKHLAAQLREIALKFQPYVCVTFVRSLCLDLILPFCSFSFRVNGEEVRLMLWDTAGQEEFDAITKVLKKPRVPHTF